MIGHTMRSLPDLGYSATPADSESARQKYIIGMAAILLLSTLHNMLGVFSVLLFAAATGALVRARVNIGWYSGAFYALALYALLRALFPSDVGLAVQLQEVPRFVAFAVFAFVVRRANLKELVGALLAFIAILLVPALLDAATGKMFSSGYRLYSLMPHANHLGYVCAVVILTFSYLYIVDFYRKGWVWAYLLVALCMLFASKSSGALFVLIFGFGAIFLSMKFTVLRFLYVIAAALILSFMLQTPVGQQALEKVTASDLELILEKADSHQFGNQGSSFAWRASYWIAMIRAQIDSGPYIVAFGQGASATSYAGQVFDFISKDPHSDVVKVLIEYGIIGLLIFFLLLVRASISAGTGLLSLVILFGPMLTGNSIISPPVVLPILICLALLRLASRKSNEKKNSA